MKPFLIAAFAFATNVHAQAPDPGDARRGAQAFRACAACHLTYLKAVAQGKAAPAEGGGRMMGMGRSKPDLSQAPAEARVKSIRRCKDTYTVETADGDRASIVFASPSEVSAAITESCP